MRSTCYVDISTAPRRQEMTTMTMLALYTVCQLHAFTVMVGPGSLLSEYECPTCIEIADGDTWRPCCSAYNTTCCGHDDYDYEPDTKWPGVIIDSPDYSNNHRSANLADVPF